MLEQLKSLGISPAILALLAGGSVMIPQILNYISFAKKFVSSVLVLDINLSSVSFTASSLSLQDIALSYFANSKHCKVFIPGNVVRYDLMSIYSLILKGPFIFIGKNVRNENKKDSIVRQMYFGLYRFRPFIALTGLELTIKFMRIHRGVEERLLADILSFYKERVLSVMDSEDKKSRFFIRRVVGTSLTSMYKSYDREKKRDSGNLVAMADSSTHFYTLNPVNVTKEDLREHLTPTKEDKSFDSIFFSVDQRDLVGKIRVWFEHKDWFERRGIQWKMGILLHGLPGTGKTSLVKKVAYEFDLPVFVFDLATLTNEEFYEEWDSMLSHTPCITLFEDFDSIFHGRKNVSVESKLTFDSILNCIDGLKETNGVVTFVTTNEIDKIDPAMGGLVDGNPLSTRPGRIDYRLEFGPMEREERSHLTNLLLDEWTEEDKSALVDSGEGMTAAQYKGVCQEKALGKFK